MSRQAKPVKKDYIGIFRRRRFASRSILRSATSWDLSTTLLCVGWKAGWGPTVSLINRINRENICFGPSESSLCLCLLLTSKQTFARIKLSASPANEQGTKFARKNFIKHEQKNTRKSNLYTWLYFDAKRNQGMPIGSGLSHNNLLDMHVHQQLLWVQRTGVYEAEHSPRKWCLCSNLNLFSKSWDAAPYCPCTVPQPIQTWKLE